MYLILDSEKDFFIVTFIVTDANGSFEERIDFEFVVFPEDVDLLVGYVMKDEGRNLN
jgi:hypothetical protein